ncbi:MAG: Rv2231c family pyridoxal phosphate-dependent protein CobC [bacterium]
MTEELRFHGDQVTGDGMLDFAVNVWEAPLSGRLRGALQSALDGLGRYPNDRPAREALARRHGRSPDEVVVLNGACEAFWLLAPALRPQHPACVHPGFTEPEAALRAAGLGVARVLRSPTDWRLVPSHLPRDADLVVLDNPNNPTGRLDPADAVADVAREGRAVVVDESFIELTQHPGQSLAGRQDLPGLVVVRSLTKLYGLAGLRAGYLLAPPDIAERLSAARQPWSVNSLALAAIQVCAADVTAARKIAAEVAAARSDLVDRVRSLPRVRTWPGSANFVLAEVPGCGRRVVDTLRRSGVAVRPAASFPGLGPDHLRLAVRNPSDHSRLVAAMHRALVDV